MPSTSGRVSIVIGGVPYSSRAEMNISPSNISVTAAANSDGTVYRTVTAEVRTAEMSLDKKVLTAPDGSPMKWNEAMMEIVDLPATFTEMDGRKQHFLNGAFFTGKPSQNLGTGEISGLGLAYEDYDSRDL